ncbi:hypothetical protein BDN71DRAFT_881239 [Pleurotus eryngii]|uniref:Secreted protein n=1 Tax=Pleurotus eryngii TaxID=5323 RepID=A0A9P6DG46_PLEER|nr:hypothetical protein BDN71DRAFT_881239 [Pleurotus eryngii]
MPLLATRTCILVSHFLDFLCSSTPAISLPVSPSLVPYRHSIPLPPAEHSLRLRGCLPSSINNDSRTAVNPLWHALIPKLVDIRLSQAYIPAKRGTAFLHFSIPRLTSHRPYPISSLTHGVAHPDLVSRDGRSRA